MSNLPKIEHAFVELNERNRVVVKMNDGYVFWRRDMYVDENGNIYEPTKEKLLYSSYGVFAPETNFDLFVVIEKPKEEQRKTKEELLEMYKKENI